MRNRTHYTVQIKGNGLYYSMNLDSTTVGKLSLIEGMLEQGLKADNPDYNNVRFSNSTLVRLAIDHLFETFQSQLQNGVGEREESIAFARAEFNRLCALADRDPDKVLEGKERARKQKKRKPSPKKKGTSPATVGKAMPTQTNEEFINE